LHSVAGRMQKAPRSLTSRGFSDVAVKETAHMLSHAIISRFKTR
jgi:hypothetical protein